MKKYIHAKKKNISLVLTDGSMIKEDRIHSGNVDEILLDLDYTTHPAWAFYSGKGQKIRKVSSDQLNKFRKRYQ